MSHTCWVHYTCNKITFNANKHRVLQSGVKKKKNGQSRMERQGLQMQCRKPAQQCGLPSEKDVAWPGQG